MSKNFRALFLILGGMLILNSISASNFQSFNGINFSNTAELAFAIQNAEWLAGDTYIIPSIHFNGTIFIPDPTFEQDVVGTGTVANTSTYYMYYGRYAQRLSKQWLFDLDISQPYKGIIEYPAESFVRFDTIATDITSIYFVPSIIYQGSGKFVNLALAGGVDYLKLSGRHYQNYPSPPIFIPFGAGPDTVVINRYGADTYTWHTGMVYRIHEKTYLGLSYYSSATPKLSGTSLFTGFPDSDELSGIFKLPSTTTLSIRRFFTDDWMTLLQLHYTGWSRLKEVTLHNVAGPVTTVTNVLNLRDSLEADLSTTYYPTPKILLGAGIAYDQTPTVYPTSRRLNIPEVDQYAVTLSLGYKFVKSVLTEIIYTHVFMVSNVAINRINPEDGSLVVGSAKVSADGVGLQITVDI